MAEYTDDFGAGHTAGDWTHHEDSATRDAVTDDFDFALTGADIVSVFNANNSGSLDHEAQITVLCHSGGEPIFVGPGVRMYDNASYACYGCWGNRSLDEFHIGKLTAAGNFISQNNSTVAGISQGDYITMTLSAIDNGSDVDLALYITNHGGTKPSSDPGWLTSPSVPSAEVTFTDPSASTPLNNATNHVDCGIAGDNAISTDYDTGHDWFKLRAISDRTGATVIPQLMYNRQQQS